MDLNNYINKIKKTYPFRLKTVVPLGEEELNKIEFALAKYNIIDMYKPVETPHQSQPLDFTNDVKNTTVWICDFILDLPATSYVLQQELRNSLNIPEYFIVVRSPNDPLEVESERQNAINDLNKEAEGKGLVRASYLSTSSTYSDAEQNDNIGKDYVGNEYVSKFLNFLKQVEDNRKPMKVNNKDSLFNWLNMPKDETIQADDFNGGTEPSNRSEGDNPTSKLAPNGNFDSSSINYIRSYKNENGDLEDLKRISNGVKKESK